MTPDCPQPQRECPLSSAKMEAVMTTIVEVGHMREDLSEVKGDMKLLYKIIVGNGDVDRAVIPRLKRIEDFVSYTRRIGWIILGTLIPSALGAAGWVIWQVIINHT